jgi:hypothetical protein
MCNLVQFYYPIAGERFRRVRIDGKVPNSHFRPSILMCTSISLAPTGSIYVKFDIGDFHENLSRNSEFD